MRSIELPHNQAQIEPRIYIYRAVSGATDVAKVIMVAKYCPYRRASSRENISNRSRSW